MHSKMKALTIHGVQWFGQIPNRLTPVLNKIWIPKPAQGQLFWLLLFLPTILEAQSTDYFQQKTDYRIEVKLDDRSHRLEGTVWIDYHNQSPEVLEEIFFHLWANAYQDKTTAFAKQQLRNGQTRFHFAPDHQRGGYTEVSFWAGETELKWSPWQDHPDVVRVVLAEPLLPGDRRQFRISFTLQIPASFSRLGHIGESYQLTQWYPKPAVYDRDGWHPMPYLDVGEFYSEYGDFDVEITLPRNYVVAATGTLQTDSELLFLSQKRRMTNQYLQDLAAEKVPLNWEDPFPASSTQTKTIRYTAERVHDFAWFADKRFLVQRSQVELSRENQVETWAFFTKYQAWLWSEALDYLESSLRFYSDAIGDYPYPQMTAVQSALSAGAGMEYPMITVIGAEYSPFALEQVILHEVGHNWFYGILGFNERDHGWLDEGLNTFYEQRYLQEKYDYEPLDFIPSIVQGTSTLKQAELLWLIQARRGRHQPVDTPSDSLSRVNYWLNYYDLPAFHFRHLEAYLGRERFDPIMQSFFEKWAFRHPRPQDVQRFWATATGEELDWLFRDHLGSTAIQDYNIREVTPVPEGYRVRIRNNGSVAAPFPLAAYREDSLRSIHWVEGFAGEKEITIPGQGVQEWIIDPDNLTLEYKRRNNNYWMREIWPRFEPLQFRFIPRVENGRKTQLNFTPTLGWNNYDKLMFGLLRYNIGVPQQNLELVTNSMFSIGGTGPIGSGLFTWNIIPRRGGIRSINMSLGARRFHYAESAVDDYPLAYIQARPRIELVFRTPEIVEREHSLQLSANFIDRQVSEGPPEGGGLRPWTRLWSYQTRYRLEDFRVLRPYSFELGLRHDRFSGEQPNWQVYAEYDGRFAYQEHKHIFLRSYLGRTLNPPAARRQTGLPNAFDLNYRGWNDVHFERYFIGRSEVEGFLNQEIAIGEAGFKQATPADVAPRSDQWLFAVNLMADIPQPFPAVPLRPYLDLAWLGGEQEQTFWWSGGLALELWHHRVGVYLPLAATQAYEQLWPEQKWYERITFSLNLTGWNPYKLLGGQ